MRASGDIRTFPPPCFQMVENKGGGGKVSDHGILQIYSKYLKKFFACGADFQDGRKQGGKGSRGGGKVRISPDRFPSNINPFVGSLPPPQSLFSTDLKSAPQAIFSMICLYLEDFQDDPASTLVFNHSANNSYWGKAANSADLIN